MQAQNLPLGSWRSYLPYNRAVSVATSGSKLFVATEQSFFTYDIADAEVNTYSKVNGMSDLGLSYVSYDPATDMAILAYSNSNVDLFSNETFYNIPDLKLKAVTGDKRIYQIYTENGMAYMSTGLGIIVINMEKKEVKESYIFTKDGQSFPVMSIAADAASLYAATPMGLYKTAKNNPNIQASASWKILDSTHSLQHAVYAAGKVFVATADSVFVLNSDTLKYVLSRDGAAITHLDSLNGYAGISMYNSTTGSGTTIRLNAGLAIADSFNGSHPMQAAQSMDNSLWVADDDWGLRSPEKTIIPEGPAYVGVYDILTDQENLTIAHGSYDERWNVPSPPNFYGISVLENGKWTQYNRNYPAFAGLEDAVRLAKDPADGTLYVASLTQGLYYLKTDKTGGRYREGYFEPNLVDVGTYRVTGVLFDQNQNLWATQLNSEHELVARSKEGTWYKFGLDNAPSRNYWENGAAGVIIDDYNQKWFFSPSGGGVLVYNDNNTIDDASDDKYVDLTADKTRGNLPDNYVQCLVNDRKGAVWIGTINGIGIVSCPDQVISRNCQAEIRIVQYDQFPGQLFVGENVKTIAVDGANRKWVGTNNGVWLISEDGTKIISRFTVDNSPLPSNLIQVIKVDPVTGTVYIGTANGLISYRGTSTEGGTSNKQVKVFPNPVRSGYTGTIAISGLVENADVRITDISGQLIYRTKALGGQAIWSGLDYTGRRPQSGVFLIFVTNIDGTETYTGKMVFIK